MVRTTRFWIAASLSLALAGCAHAVALAAAEGGTFIPTGQYVTPTAATGSVYARLATGLREDGNADADDAVSSALSPDGKTLLVLTSGFNKSIYYQNAGHQPLLFAQLDPISGLPSGKTMNQAEWVFVYDVTAGAAQKVQQIPIPNTYEGLAWDPSGSAFYVSGGIDDRVLVFRAGNSKPVAQRFAPSAPFVILNHNSNDRSPIPNYDGGLLSGTVAGKAEPDLVTGAIAGGLDVSEDGKTLVVANYGNASASIVDLAKADRPITHEVVFYAPGGTVARGEYPFWVAVLSNPSNGAYEKAYVTSQRDDQVMVVSGGTLTKVIGVPRGPNKLTLSADQSKLYVACGDDDSIAVIDTADDALADTIPLARPGDPYKGSWPDDVTLAPSGKLYVTLGGENAVAVIDPEKRRVLGRIPVGWYPTSVRVGRDGAYLWTVNEKSNAGPNPGQTYYSWNTPYGKSLNTTSQNAYTWEAEKGGIVSMPVPDDVQLAALSRQVDRNDGFGRVSNDDTMAFLRKRIKHVIYIVNENRTFDQVLGDLHNGSNGDARLTFFTQPVTPNLHALAAEFVTLDNFYDSSETSGVGWNWVMQGHTNAYTEQTQPVDYGNSGGNGFSYDWQGIVKNVNLGLPATGAPTIYTTRITGILDPSGSSTILPGERDPAATEGADDLSKSASGGYIWEDALRHGLTVRNYGWQIDLTYYGTKTPYAAPPVRDPFRAKTLQSAPSTRTLQSVTDRYYRGFDMTYPDVYRIEEWQREFAGFVRTGTMPNLMVMTIPHDHTGAYSAALEGLNTPQLELADHDYAIGMLVETLSHSKYWGSSAVVMLEDDPQDGQDHVEAHRSIIHIISPYTHTRSVIHTRYTSVNALRTVEALLGLPPLGMNDAKAVPMSDVFARRPNPAGYAAVVPGALCAKPVATDLVPRCGDPQAPRTAAVASLHDGDWWARMTAGMDFREPDQLDAPRYNALLEYGILGPGTAHS